MNNICVRDAPCWGPKRVKCIVYKLLLRTCFRFERNTTTDSETCVDVEHNTAAALCPCADLSNAWHRNFISQYPNVRASKEQKMSSTEIFGYVTRIDNLLLVATSIKMLMLRTKYQSSKCEEQHQQSNQIEGKFK